MTSTPYVLTVTRSERRGGIETQQAYVDYKAMRADVLRRFGDDIVARRIDEPGAVAEAFQIGPFDDGTTVTIRPATIESIRVAADLCGEDCTDAQSVACFNATLGPQVTR